MRVSHRLQGHQVHDTRIPRRMADRRYYRPHAVCSQRRFIVASWRIWLIHFGPIPKFITTSTALTANPDNNDIENLECLRH